MSEDMIAKLSLQVKKCLERNITLRAENERLMEALRNIVLNAVIGPDVSMGGSTDCYHVPFDDIETANAALKEVGGE